MKKSEIIGDKQQAQNKASGIPRYYYQKELTILKEMVDFSNKKTLDIGCGVGRLPMSMSTCSGIYHGIDLSHDLIDDPHDRFRSSSDHQFSLMDATNIGFKKSSFDVVVALGTFWYVEDFKPILEELSRILKPDGDFIISTFNANCIPFDGNDYSSRDNYHHKNELDTQFLKSGFKPHKHTSTLHLHDLLNVIFFWKLIKMIPMPQRASRSMIRFINLIEKKLASTEALELKGKVLISHYKLQNSEP